MGRTLSHFEITGKLGEGGMGEVYLARDTKLDRPVALKVLPSEVVGDPDRIKRLQREAKALAALDHPNIVTVFSVEEADGVHFLTMAYVEGSTLDELIESGGLPLERLLSLAIPLADALRAAHERGIVHRDLKPGNVMVDKEGRLRVLDFGLAKLQPTGTADPDTKTQTMTRHGVVLGTYPYMAPEQAEGKPADARSDIFSLGVLLYEMATGNRPFRGETPASLITAILRDAPESLTEARPDLPERLGEIIHRCLEKDPDRRYQSARQAREELEQLQRDVVSGQIGGSLAGSGVRVSPPRRMVVIGAMVVVAALGSAALWYARRGLEATRGVASQRQIASLAVLPLENLSGDTEEDYFVDGMTAALITDLSRIRELKVIARSSVMRYKGTDKPLDQIARELNVDTLLDGSVLREADRVAVTAQLIDATNEQNIWARRYEREMTGVLALQGEVARTIAEEIAIQLTPDEQSRFSDRRQVNPQTYEAYLRGMYQLNKGTAESFDLGMQYLNEAIEHDAADPWAYAGLALGYIRMGHDGVSPETAFPRAMAAANRALDLDPNLAEAYAAIADAKMYHEWDFDGARKAFERAVELNPSLAEAHAHYTWYYAIFADWDRAVAEARRAQELDPLSPVYTGWLGCLLWYMGDFDAAVEETRKSLDLNPDFGFGLYTLGSIFSSQGKYDEAIEVHKKTSEVSPGWGWALASSYGRAGRPEEARRVLEDWPLKDEPGMSLNVAMAYGFMGETDKAIEWLERGYENRNAWMPWIGVFPELRSLHGDPRFQEMLRRMNISK